MYSRKKKTDKRILNNLQNIKNILEPNLFDTLKSKIDFLKILNYRRKNIVHKNKWIASSQSVFYNFFDKIDNRSCFVSEKAQKYFEKKILLKKILKA